MNTAISGTHVLSVSNISAVYDTVPVLCNVSLVVRSGEVVCLSGPNGSGKSTLLSLMAGIIPDGLTVMPANATACFDSTPLLHINRKETAQRIAYMVQDEQSAWNYTVRDIVLTGRYAHTANGNYTEHDYEIADTVIADMGIAPLADRRIFSLSGGEAQKVRIARSLAQEPAMLLLDEPVANLDFGYQSELLAFIRKLAHERELGVLVSIHDLNTAARFADRIALLPKGGTVTVGKPEDVLTAENLSHTYGVPFGVFVHPSYGCVQVYTK